MGLQVAAKPPLMLNHPPALCSNCWRSDSAPIKLNRCGVLPFVFEEDFGFARYAEYALDVPMYFVYR